MNLFPTPSKSPLKVWFSQKAKLVEVNKVLLPTHEFPWEKFANLNFVVVQLTLWVLGTPMSGSTHAVSIVGKIRYNPPHTSSAEVRTGPGLISR